MDKTAIRNFAIEARKLLMKSAITEAGFYGITKDGCKTPIQKGNDFEVYETLTGTENRIYGNDIKRRANLVKAIEQQGFDQVIEEIAYTWFNRIIAIRFMEVNNYLPTRVRVLSSETGSGTPDIITQADTVELNLSEEELDKIQNAKCENKYDEAFRILFIKQCNELNEILPGLFEKTNDYMELLLKITYTGDGVVRMLVDTIPEDNFNVETEGQVEIIGWMYQYYNTELKDDTFAKLKKNVKITKERIPAATQLFTPDWIVRYMVENSLGRVWIEHLRAVDLSVDEKAKADEFGWKYYLPEAEQEEAVAAQLVDIRKEYRDLTPQDITCIDPCMGSGHILVYMFDVLMDIYRSEGFSEREAVFDILEKNIRGLDIDRRAYQLSYFALMMKARGYNRIFFRGRENIDGERVQVVPQVYAIEESNVVNRNQLKYFGEGLSEIDKNDAAKQLMELLDQLINAKEYGSILEIEQYNWELLNKYVSRYSIDGQMNFEMVGIDFTQKSLFKLINQARIIREKYDVCATNPPYMAASGMNAIISDYIKKRFSNSKNDLYTVFIEKCRSFVKKYGYQAMITQQGWMFLSGYEKLRDNMLKYPIENMIHLGPRAFDEISGEVVQTTSFVIRNVQVDIYSTFKKLTEGKSEHEKEVAFFNNEYEYKMKQSLFYKAPAKRIIYWINKADIWDKDRIEKAYVSGGRNKTHNNEKYVRAWWEVKSDNNWRFYMNGGAYRKWYGNLTDVVLWSTEAKKEYASHGGLVDESKANKYGISWNGISGNNPAFRLKPQNVIYSSSSPTIISIKGESPMYALGLLNSCVGRYMVNSLNPTLQLNVGEVLEMPYIEEQINDIAEKAQKCVEFEEDEWNEQEISKEYVMNPLVQIAVETANICDGKASILIENVWNEWNEKCKQRFRDLKQLEEDINKQAIRLYGMEDELIPDVDETTITLRKADLLQDIRSLISYAVGCMFGRFSLKEGGVQNIGEKIDISKYEGLTPDLDNVIPITDEEYFENDIVSLFRKWIEAAFGSETADDNMNFIAQVLGNKGNSVNEILRNYFLNDFYKDHCNMYSVAGAGKRPIYWMFDAGKKNGFKCLIYIHRYHKDLVGVIRSDYLLKAQIAIENALKNMEYVLGASGSSVDKAQATKKRDKYLKQLAEIKTYYQALSHIALQRIELDMDDGVKTNYAKFQEIEVSNEGEKKQSIDLLAKIK